MGCGGLGCPSAWPHAAAWHPTRPWRHPYKPGRANRCSLSDVSRALCGPGRLALGGEAEATSPRRVNYFLGLGDSANSCALLVDTWSPREIFHTVGANRG